MNLRFIFKRFRRLINHYFWHDKIIFVSFLVSSGLNIFNWLFVLSKIKSLEVIVPLHYNVYFGIDMIGSKYEMLKIPGLGLFIFLVNVFLAFRIYKHERLNAYFLLIATCLIELFLIVAAFLIIKL